MHGIDDFADVADTGAAGGIHFHHVHMAAFHDGHAMFALAAGVGGGAAGAVRPDAVHALGDDPCGCGFAGAADARHDERLRDPVRFERVFQRADHGLLSDQIDKGLGPVFARQNAIGCRGVFGHGPAIGIRINAVG